LETFAHVDDLLELFVTDFYFELIEVEKEIDFGVSKLLSFLSLEKSGFEAHQDDVIHAIDVGGIFAGDGFLEFFSHGRFVKKCGFLIPVNTEIGQYKTFAQRFILELLFGSVNKNWFVIFINSEDLQLFKSGPKRVLVVNLIFVSDMDVFDGDLKVINDFDDHT
jgi:hypothetical protein